MTHSSAVVFRPWTTNVLDNRDSFIGTFDKLFDEMARNNFPEVFKNWGAEPISKSAYPKVNVTSTAGAITIEAELAGFTKDQVDIEVKEGILTISGRHKQDTTKEEAEFTGKVVYLLRELKRTVFSRSFTLGNQLDASRIQAEMHNGLLTITIPKLVKEPTSTKVTIK
jgi:HSP20 family protein